MPWPFRQSGRHEDLIGDRVVTTGATQAERVPGVENLEVFFA
jgi:hypothetical protein